MRGWPGPFGWSRASAGGAVAARVTPPPLHRVPGLDSSDPKAVEASGKGLWVEASKGTGGTKAV